MQLYLVRHGEAVAEADDPARPLSARGRDEIERVARHVADRGVRVAEIRHSPLLRARQTAEILASRLLPEPRVRGMEGLSPSDDPRAARAACEAASEAMMLVGHLPHLSRLVSSLLIGDPGREIIGFVSGAIVCLTRAESGWVVEWILTPELATSEDLGRPHDER